MKWFAAEGAGGFDIILSAKNADTGADHAGDGGKTHDAEHDNRGREAGGAPTERGGGGDGQEEKRKREQNVSDAHEDSIDAAPKKASGKTDEGAEKKGEARAESSDEQGETRAECEAGGDAAAEGIGAKRIRRRGRQGHSGGVEPEARLLDERGVFIERMHEDRGDEQRGDEEPSCNGTGVVAAHGCTRYRGLSAVTRG